MSDIKEETNTNDFEGDISEKEVLLKKQDESAIEETDVKVNSAKNKFKPIIAIIIDDAIIFGLAMVLLQIVDFIMQNTVYYTFSDKSAAILLMFIITSVLYFSILENLKNKKTIGKIIADKLNA